MIRFAAKFPEKEASLDYWFATKWPVFHAGLARAKSGYTGSVELFETIAPAVVPE